MTRLLVRVSLMCGLLLGMAGPASAQVVHSVSFGVGIFNPRAFDSRVAGDTLVANLTRPEVAPGVTDSLDFRIQDFRAVPVNGEWQIAFGRHIELGVGLSYANKRVASVYRDLVNGHGTPSEADDTEIRQDLRLRQVPITGVVRVVFGPQDGVQGYVGGGVAAVVFRYSEVGEFVDTDDFSVFQGRFVASDVALGGVLLGGARFGLGGDIYALTLEGRYQFANGKTGGLPNFLGDKIDLSGGSINFGFLVRF